MDLSRVKCDEPWKKRPFFPEDIINADIRFHFGLLSPSCVTARRVE